MPGMIAIVVAGAIMVLGLLHGLVRFLHDTREPPIVPSTIPFFGHVPGLLRKKTKYYVELRDKYQLPISTLYLPGTKLYVVNSSSLISSVQKNFKVLAFAPIQAMAAKNICGSSKTANDILDTNVNGDDGPSSYSTSHYPAVRKAISPGTDLDAMNRVMVQRVAAQVERMQEMKQVQLMDFIRHELTMATTESVYGPQNPFRDPEVEKSFFEFQHGVLVLMIKLFPTIFARKCLVARDYLTHAFVRYFENGGHIQGSALIQTRHDHSREYSIPVEDIARFECGGAISILSNTNPTTFWMVYHLYSDKNLLDQCRQELSAIISEETITDAAGKTTRVQTLDMTDVKISCPNLVATFQEVLRVHTVGTSVRIIMEDHMLDGKYLLKKGNCILMPGPVQHTSVSAYGSTVNTFDHRRFLVGEKSHDAAAFRGFGGGTTLCPGRHFATTEILAFTALMAIKFDVTPTSGAWVCPSAVNSQMWETTEAPDHDVEVTIKPRMMHGSETRLKVLLTDSDKDILPALDNEIHD